MKRKVLFTTQVILFGLFGLSLIITGLQLFGEKNPLKRYDEPVPVYNGVEEFDPSLLRLSSMKKIEQYCDSIYAEQALAGKADNFEMAYTDIVSNVVRNRFYHGYSHYSMNDNYLSVLFSKATIPGLNAHVIPDEILKYPYAACSQQSIVMMEMLINKGFKTRKVGFIGTDYGGHFAFEVFYGGKWHFNDPNLEPDMQVLDQYGRPGIQYLNSHPDVLLQAYNRCPAEKIMDIFPNYYYGPINTYPAPRAIVFQKATAFLSHTIWILFLIGFAVARYYYVRLKKRAPVYNLTPVRQIQPIPTAI